MAPDPKPTLVRGNRPRRIIDPAAVRLAALADPTCAACGGPGANGHHALPKDRGGDDVRENIINLCGSGTTGCHGAHHGSPYAVEEEQPWASIEAALRGEPDDMTIRVVERRDAEWVNRRVGQTLVERRQDVIGYIVGKLGDGPGGWFLERTYHVVRGEDGEWTTTTES